MTLEARCRNCGNTGYDMFHRLCPCKVGKALAQIAAAGLGNAPFPVDAFTSASDAVAAQAAIEAALAQEAPQASEPRAIIQHFAAAMERKLAANDGVKGGWRDDGHWMRVYQLFAVELRELLQALRDRDRVLSELGALNYEWENGALLSRIDAAEDELVARYGAANTAVLDETADCANYLMMLCDVIGALPSTDERGR